METSFRTTGILLAIAVALSLYVYFFEQDPPDWMPQGGVFAHVGYKDFSQVRIVPGAAKVASAAGLDVYSGPIGLSYEKDPAGGLPRWRLVEPFSFPVFVPRLEGILTSIMELHEIAPVEAGEGAIFGPDGPLVTVHFKTRDSDSIQHTIEVGQDHPDSSIRLLYVRVDGERAFLTQKRHKRNFDVYLDELRSREVFPVPRDDAVRLEIKRPDYPQLVMSRPHGSLDWRVEQPYRGLADRILLNALLDNLNSWRIESFVSDTIDPESSAGQATLRKLGFSDRVLSVRLTHRNGQAYHFEVARDPSGELEDQVYLRDPSKPFVYTIPSQLIPDLERAPDEFRSRHLLQLGATEIFGIRGKYIGDGVEKAFRVWKEEKLETPQDEKPVVSWRVEDRRLDSTYDADRVTARGFIDRLKTLEVRRYLDRPLDPAYRRVVEGASAPRLTLELELDGTRPIELIFRDPPASESFAAPTFVVTQRSGRGEQAEAEHTLVTTLMPADLASGGIYFRDRSISTYAASDFEELIISSGTLRREWRLSRILDLWYLNDDDKIRKKKDESLDQQLIDEITRNLSKESFRVEAFLPDRRDKAELERLELTEKRYRMRIKVERPLEKGSFKVLTLGAMRDQSPGQESYARFDTIDMPVLLDRAFESALRDLINHLDSIIEK